LEDFAICPYKYFLDYTIELSEREKYEIDARDMGNIFHKVLEEMFESSSFDIASMDYKDIDIKVQNTIDNIIKANDKFSDTSEAKFLSERLRDTVTYSLYRLKENLYNTNPTHIASEEKLSYNIKDTKDILSGKIDTIDNYKKDDEKADFVRVVDYKSSDKMHNDEDLKSGVNIQYIVYLDYVLHNLKSICKKHKIPYDEAYLFSDT
ncbi:MAG: PD-(D/E)XK nuclease family protein, partial [Lachnospiraceae bacterium]|nr:PD-(D/E)XK nuclease family protein [Lachnospiraceae bacterium]